jgi:actin-related protein
MNTTTLNQPIVIDNGTGVMKAGFGGYVINSLLLQLKIKIYPL